MSAISDPLALAVDEAMRPAVDHLAFETARAAARGDELPADAEILARAVEEARAATRWAWRALREGASSRDRKELLRGLSMLRGLTEATERIVGDLLDTLEDDAL